MRYPERSHFRGNVRDPAIRARSLAPLEKARGASGCGSRDGSPNLHITAARDIAHGTFVMPTLSAFAADRLYSSIKFW
jgi:hypothetical protein